MHGIEIKIVHTCQLLSQNEPIKSVVCLQRCSPWNMPQNNRKQGEPAQILIILAKTMRNNHNISFHFKASIKKMLNLWLFQKASGASLFSSFCDSSSHLIFMCVLWLQWFAHIWFSCAFYDRSDLLTFSRVDTDVLMEIAYSCNFLAVCDSSTCPDIGTSWCHAGIIEHFEIRGFKMTP